jgi:hypothetical protein
MHVSVSEGACLDLEAIIPIPPPQTLGEIGGDREKARLPLLYDVAVLMKHEPGVFEELGGAATQVDPASAGRSDRPPVEAHE